MPSILNALKKDIKNKEEINFVAEAMTGIVDDDVIDAFLDDEETGYEDDGDAELDPEVASILDKIPETNDEDVDIEDLIENFIPESILSKKEN